VKELEALRRYPTPPTPTPSRRGRTGSSSTASPEHLGLRSDSGAISPHLIAERKAAKERAGRFHVNWARAQASLLRGAFEEFCTEGHIVKSVIGSDLNYIDSLDGAVKPEIASFLAQVVKVTLSAVQASVLGRAPGEYYIKRTISSKRVAWLKLLSSDDDDAIAKAYEAFVSDEREMQGRHRVLAAIEVGSAGMAHMLMDSQPCASDAFCLDAGDGEVVIISSGLENLYSFGTNQKASELEREIERMHVEKATIESALNCDVPTPDYAAVKARRLHLATEAGDPSHPMRYSSRARSQLLRENSQYRSFQGAPEKIKDIAFTEQAGLFLGLLTWLGDTDVAHDNVGYMISTESMAVTFSSCDRGMAAHPLREELGLTSPGVIVSNDMFSLDLAQLAWFPRRISRPVEKSGCLSERGDWIGDCIPMAGRIEDVENGEVETAEEIEKVTNVLNGLYGSIVAFSRVSDETIDAVLERQGVENGDIRFLTRKGDTAHCNPFLELKKYYKGIRDQCAGLIEKAAQATPLILVAKARQGRWTKPRLYKELDHAGFLIHREMTTSRPIKLVKGTTLRKDLYSLSCNTSGSKEEFYKQIEALPVMMRLSKRLKGLDQFNREYRHVPTLPVYVAPMSPGLLSVSADSMYVAEFLHASPPLLASHLSARASVLAAAAKGPGMFGGAGFILNPPGVPVGSGVKKVVGGDDERSRGFDAI
jgi:hypothetical protein